MDDSAAVVRISNIDEENAGFLIPSNTAIEDMSCWHIVGSRELIGDRHVVGGGKVTDVGKVSAKDVSSEVAIEEMVSKYPRNQLGH